MPRLRLESAWEPEEKKKEKENMKKHKGATGRRTSSSRETGIPNTLQHWRQVSRPQLHTHDTSRTTRNTEHGTRFPSFVDNIFPTSDPAAVSAWLSARTGCLAVACWPVAPDSFAPEPGLLARHLHRPPATTTSAKKKGPMAPSHCTTLHRQHRPTVDRQPPMPQTWHIHSTGIACMRPQHQLLTKTSHFARHD